jgi:hypothetical protein
LPRQKFGNHFENQEDAIMAKVAELDKDLVDGLKAAKTKRAYFALVLKGSNDGALIVSKTKVPPTGIADAKKKSGGSAVVQGFCSHEDGKYIFETAKEAPATAAQAVKIIVKRDAEMTISAEFRISTDPELLAAEGDAPATSAQSVQPKQSGQKAALNPLPETAKYEAAFQTWEQASAVALSAVDKLVSALEATEDEVAMSIVAIIKDLQANFPDTLDDVLTNLAKAAKSGNAADTESYRVRSEIAIKAALAYLNNNALTIEGCEHNPFGISVPFRAALTEALKHVLIAVKK